MHKWAVSDIPKRAGHDRRKEMSEGKKEVSFRYVFPGDLRDLYVNGAWGGITPRGELYLHLYSERQPVPKTTVHEIASDGSLGAETGRETGGDVVRIVQTSVVMKVETARLLRDWLDERIDRMENMFTRQKERD